MRLLIECTSDARLCVRHKTVELALILIRRAFVVQNIYMRPRIVCGPIILACKGARCFHVGCFWCRANNSNISDGSNRPFLGPQIVDVSLQQTAAKSRRDQGQIVHGRLAPATKAEKWNQTGVHYSFDWTQVVEWLGSWRESLEFEPLGPTIVRNKSNFILNLSRNERDSAQHSSPQTDIISLRNSIDIHSRLNLVCGLR